MNSYMDCRFAAVDGTVVVYDGSDRNLTIPAVLGRVKVTAIGRKAFSHSDVEVVRVPSTVKALNREAFSSCPKLHTVYLPSSVATKGNIFEKSDALRMIYFDEITLSQEEADRLYASSTDVGDGVYMTQLLPKHPLFEGIRQYQPLCEPHPVAPEGARLFYLKDIRWGEAEPCCFDTGADNSEQTSRTELIKSGGETYWNALTEEKIDESQRKNETPEPERVGVLFYRRGASPQKIRGRIQIGLYFWQSLIPVVLQGGRFAIYRRCFLSQRKGYQYIATMSGVFDAAGECVDRQIEERVYAKYAIMSIL